MKFHVKSGDKVVVIAGNNKGKEGTIQKVLTKKKESFDSFFLFFNKSFLLL